MKINKITIAEGQSQTLQEKVEVLKDKINEIIDYLSKEDLNKKELNNEKNN